MNALTDVLAVREAANAAGWEARLDLGFRRDGARTLLAHRRHVGPLCVQKALHPEGPEVCQAIVVHPPGGIVGGDRLAIRVDVGEGAHAQLTTPGASKWYRSAGAEASARARLAVATNATLEWLPQETLVFDGARVAVDTRIDLARGARFFGWDVVGLGRRAAGERFDSGRLRLRMELHCDGTLAFIERAVLEGGSAALQSGAVLAGEPAFGTMLAAGGDIDDALVARCRAIACPDGEAALTRLAHVLVARYRGPSAAAARMYFAMLWQALRPVLLGRDAVPPRIWNT